MKIIENISFVLKCIFVAVIPAVCVMGYYLVANGKIDIVTMLFLIVTIVVPMLFIMYNKPIGIITNFASTMGVLGTFVGVFIGLLEFDTSDISASVPPLLEGLKTAFLTSIVGMIVALLVKLFYKPNVKGDKLPTVEIEGGDKMLEMIALLVDAVRDIRRQNDDIKTAVVEVPFTLAKINDDINKGVKDIEMKIQQFGEIVAEQSSKELIKAIEKVIKDFNNKINNQLGESFKELTESCRQLNEWQQQHVELLNCIRQYTDESKNNARDSALLFENINAQILLFRQNEEMLQKQLHATAFMLEKSQQLGVECRDIVPNLQRDVLAMTNAIKAMVEDVDNVVKQSCDSLNANSVSLKRSVEEINGKMNQAMSNFSSTLISILKEFNERSFRGNIYNR